MVTLIIVDCQVDFIAVNGATKAIEAIKTLQRFP